MFAVIRTGGKQYRVAKDDVIRVEKLAVEPGKKVTLDEVLMVGEGSSVKVGTPLVEGAAVTAEVLEQARARKIIVFKKKRRKNYRRTRGHRQHETVLRIIDIGGAAKKKAATATEAKNKAAPRKTVEKAEPEKPAQAAAKKKSPTEPVKAKTDVDKETS